MPAKLSRRKITEYIADVITSGGDSKEAVMQLAGYLMQSGRVGELELIVRDIEYALSLRGVVIARATTAFDLTTASKNAIEAMIAKEHDAKTVHLRHFVDPDVIGGVRLDSPGKRLDRTIAHQLATLKTNYRK